MIATMRAEMYEREFRELMGVNISIESYKIGAKYHCHLASVDPGATIARSEAISREEAVREAISKASERLGRKHPA